MTDPRLRRRDAVYEYVSRHPGSTQSEVAAALDVAVGSLSYHVHALLESGKIVRNVVYSGNRGRWAYVYSTPGDASPSTDRVDVVAVVDRLLDAGAARCDVQRALPPHARRAGVKYLYRLWREAHLDRERVHHPADPNSGHVVWRYTWRDRPPPGCRRSSPPVDPGVVVSWYDRFMASVPDDGVWHDLDDVVEAAGLGSFFLDRQVLALRGYEVRGKRVRRRTP